ncbi:hypothetical protein EAE90_09125 [Photorhabdus caribbeanensis]|nr:hypothetical protein [Photorhabdus caribbeanensis]
MKNKLIIKSLFFNKEILNKWKYIFKYYFLGKLFNNDIFSEWSMIVGDTYFFRWHLLVNGYQ